MQEVRDSRSVVLDGSGNGSVTFGPDRFPWIIQRVSVRVSSNTNEPQANIYRGSVNPGSFVSGTFSGTNDTDSNLNDGVLNIGEQYVCAWTGGDAGATATVSFYGMEAA